MGISSEVVSCPAIRNVMIWLRTLSTSDRASVGVVCQHHGEQIIGGTVGAVTGDQLIEVPVQSVAVTLEFRCDSVCYRPDQRRGEALRDGRQAVVVERIEPRTEAWRARRCPSPASAGRRRRSPVAVPRRHPSGRSTRVDVEHGAVIVPQPGIAEPGQQHVVAFCQFGSPWR